MEVYLPFVFLFCLVFSSIVSANPIQITLLHTNDLHSHFRTEKGDFPLGGIARLKTAVEREKRNNPNTLLVDGGDWSEGNIYYNQGFGVEALRMMDRIGYDAAVLGNHDWINGPDILLDAIRGAQPKMALLAANLDPSDYDREEEFERQIAPYVIMERGGKKIAFIGLTTYEFIYDSFVAPLKVKDPYQSVAFLASKLKRQADVVIVISHNSIAINRSILSVAPNVDLVMGAHDHVKLTQPSVVTRPGYHDGWVVETGSWGQYLGRVQLQLENDQVELKDYKLIQLDQSIPNDPETEEQIAQLENKLERDYGPIFQDHIADSEVEFSRSGVSNPMGNLVTDAYRKFSQADFAMDITNFIYGSIPRGVIHSADVFNAIPAVYNPSTQKSWTLKTLSVSGRVIKYFLNLMYSSSKLSKFGLVNVSGISFQFDPLFQSHSGDPRSLSANLAAPGVPLAQESFPVIRDILIQGEPLDMNTSYRMATSPGMIYAIQFLNSNIVNLISLDSLEDLGMEDWRIVSDYLHSLSPVVPEKLVDVDRIRTVNQDLGISEADIRWEPLRKVSGGILTKITATVRNHGAQSSKSDSDSSPTLQLLVNKNGLDFSLEPKYEELGSVQSISSLAPGEFQDFSWEVVLSQDSIDRSKPLGVYPVTVQIQGIGFEVNHWNDEATRFFKIN